MRLNNELLRQLEQDLGLNVRFEKGKDISVSNCWHFYTNGHSVNCMFKNNSDFIHAMNLICLLVYTFKVVPLAFVLMDTHVHFVLYGRFNECNCFMHELIRRISMHISSVSKGDSITGQNNSLAGISIGFQPVENDYYLKNVICYTIKNPPEGGLPYCAWNYPWSSGSLYFRSDNWTCPNLGDRYTPITLGLNEKRTIFASRDDATLRKMGSLRIVKMKFSNSPAAHSVTRNYHLPLNGGNPFSTELGAGVGYMDMVFPEEYVAVEVVERIFRTVKSFNYFMCNSRESDIESRGGATSFLTIPIQEMRQYKNELCLKMFGARTLKQLDIGKRLKLARALKSKYNSSTRQIARLCGLVYDEVKEMIH